MQPDQRRAKRLRETGGVVGGETGDLKRQHRNNGAVGRQGQSPGRRTRGWGTALLAARRRRWGFAIAILVPTGKPAEMVEAISDRQFSDLTAGTAEQLAPNQIETQVAQNLDGRATDKLPEVPLQGSGRDAAGPGQHLDGVPTCRIGIHQLDRPSDVACGRGGFAIAGPPSPPDSIKSGHTKPIRRRRSDSVGAIRI